MIESGVKSEEYREGKPYWCKRLVGKNFTHISFSYGYTKRTMTFELESITIGNGKKEWGAPDNDVFIIKLGKKDITKKKTITETIYREIADKLRTHLKDQVYWAGSIEGEDWRFTVSLTKCGNAIIPVWWEFYIEENGNVVADDFSFERLKKYVVCEQ